MVVTSESTLVHTQECECLCLGLTTEGRAARVSGFINKCVCVCYLGKACVRWAALMCRNAKIPQWLCGCTVSLRDSSLLLEN